MKPFFLLLSALLITGCDTCYRYFYYSGTVTDSSDNPIRDVEVAFSHNIENVVATTDENGEYFFELVTRDKMQGRNISFTKTGYQTGVAEGATKEEDSEGQCVEVEIKRSLQLSP